MHFNRHAPMLLTQDVATTRDFYTRFLGLVANADIGWFVGMESPTRPKEAFELSICKADHASVPTAIRRPTDGLVLAFEVDDVDQTYTHFQREGAEILAGPVDEPWGQRHFFVQAPDGVALDIFQQIAPDPEWMKRMGF